MEFRAGPFQRAYRTTTVGRVRAAEVPPWATDIPVELDTVVNGRTVVHEFALDGDEDLQVGDHVALVSDGISLVAVLTEIDAAARCD